jgi:hypothetical protein
LVNVDSELFSLTIITFPYFDPKVEILFKQWPLAGKFVEFEYSPKICQFGKFEYSPKCPFSPFWPDSIHSPAIRQLLSPDSIHSTDIRQPFSPDSIHSILDTFADIRQNVTRIRHIRTSNSPFWQIWGEWPLLNFIPQIL